MVAKRSRKCHARSAKMAANKWLGLPIGPIGQIFADIDPIDMLLVVPLVCKDWGRVLCQIIFLKENNSLDLSHFVTDLPGAFCLNPEMRILGQRNW